ncbi:unnamed protein product [Lactuca saligna]|uniref:Leucine-rich repeat-containing N-terminal plant-type domain-containing protein n=1 Tax=Lactuca saligna TaxID=75948 RepID=A0AA35YGX6_LACSI|nr:unnamed protein product [Lactuca saligna]
MTCFNLLPLELFKCRSLKVLLLRQNLFDGEVNQGLNSSLFIQLINLNFLDLQSNSFKGVWNFETLLSSLPNLTGLDLSYSGLTVLSDNSTAYVNPNFWFLNLASCNLNAFPKSLRAMKNLQYLLLYGNNIQGRIPDLAGEIGGNRLIAADLSNNSITGLPQFQWDGITQLSFQSNMIQGPFPPSICNMSNLQYLDLSNNSFNGVIPQCIGNISSLGMLHLGANLFNGTIPNACTDYGQLTWFILNKNQFEGEVPTSLSKCRNLQILDLGNNHLYGTFPSWLSDLPGLQDISQRLEVTDGDGDEDEDESGFTWKVVMLGYGCGALPGLVIAYVMLPTGKPKWLNAIFDATEHMIQTRKNKRKRRYMFIGK